MFSALTVDRAGRAWAIGEGTDTLYRWSADGVLDLQVDLSGNVGDGPLCYPGDLAATAAHLFLLDTCNARLLRFDMEDGAFVDERLLSSREGGESYIRLARRGDDLWAACAADFVRLTDLDGALGVAARVPHPRRITIAGYATDGVHHFLGGAGSDVLHVLEGDGAHATSWAGGGDGALRTPGAFDLLSDIDRLSDGSIAVVAVQSEGIVRFRGDLLPAP
jgi:hypothetical protein